MSIRAIIIEDEEPARILLKNYLSDYDDIEFSGEFADGFSGTKAINELKPDLVFLDIQMPKLSGFEVLELIEYHPLIIFTTAFDQYALKAFEANAIDYLLKPFTRERFKTALNKAKEKLTSKITGENGIKSLINSIDSKEEYLDRVAVKSGSRIHVVATDDIIYIEATGDYVMLHTKGEQHLKEKTMKYFETHLDPKIFVRIHRSHIVNVREISKIEHYDKESYLIVLKNNTRLKASQPGYKLLKQLLNL